MALFKGDKDKYKGDSKEFIRTSPVTVYDIGEYLETLRRLANTKGDQFNQIDISWIEDAVQQKLEENANSAYEEMNAPLHPYQESVYGDGWTIGLSIDGWAVYSNDGGFNWSETKIADDNFSCICFAEYENIPNKFVALTTTGNGYISENHGLEWKKIENLPRHPYSGIAFAEDTYILVATDGTVLKSDDGLTTFKEINVGAKNTWVDICSDKETQFMIISNDGDIRSYYTANKGLAWTGIETNEKLQWTSVAYAPFCSTFAMCGIGGVNRIAYLQLPEGYEGTQPEINELAWVGVHSPDNTVGGGWTDIEASHNVFTCVSPNNTTYQAVSSYNGKEWQGVLTPEGHWKTVTRSDRFFIAFSNEIEKDEQMIMRSSNGGLTTILFATLEEAIAGNEPTKAISASILKQWFESHLPLAIEKGGTGRTDGHVLGLINGDDKLTYDGGEVDTADGLLVVDGDKIKKIKPLPVEMGGTGLEEQPTLITDLTSMDYGEVLVDRGSIGVTGILPISHGGTGRDSLSDIKKDMDLDNVDNTSDMDKPISNATQEALNNKADKVHTHEISDVNQLQNELDNKADKVHTHSVADVTGLEDSLDDKADKNHKHIISDINSDDGNASLNGNTNSFVDINTGFSFEGVYLSSNVGDGVGVAKAGEANIAKKADVADSVEWDNVQNKPTSFTPDLHTHPASDIVSGILPIERGGTGNIYNKSDLSNCIEVSVFCDKYNIPYQVFPTVLDFMRVASPLLPNRTKISFLNYKGVIVQPDTRCYIADIDSAIIEVYKTHSSNIYIKGFHQSAKRHGFFITLNPETYAVCDNDVIIDSGTDYVRFSNGFQICWGSKTNNNAVSTGTSQVTFSKAFKAITSITVSMLKASTQYSVCVGNYSVTSIHINYGKNNVATSEAVNASWLTMGTWK